MRRPSTCSESSRPGPRVWTPSPVANRPDPAGRAHRLRRTANGIATRRRGMDLNLDYTLKALIELGKRSGYLTGDQVNAQIPPDTVEPERLDQILELLDQHGISIIEEDQVEGQAARPAPEAEEDPLREVEVAFSDDGDGKHTDDPVRMYLTQMGEIPLLDRGKEISLAKKIEVTRRWFRRKVLECDFALREVVGILNRVHREELPFDRTIKISQTEKLEKDQILKRMPHNLRTVEPLMEANVLEFERLIDPATSEAEKAEVRRRLKLRRKKAVTLVEELSVRTQKIQ